MDNSKKDNSILHRQLIRSKEASANLLLAKLQICFSIAAMIFFGLIMLGFYKVNYTLSAIILIGSSVHMVAVSILTLVTKGKGRYLKYLVLISLELFAFAIDLLSGFKVHLLIAIPLVFSIRYFNKKLTGYLGIVSVVLLFLCAVFNAYVAPSIGMMDLNMVSFKDPVTIFVTTFLYKPVIDAGIDSTEVFKNSLRLSFLPNAIIMLLIEAVCLFIVQNTQNLLFEMQEETEKKDVLAQEVYNTNSKIMMSQITPHFLYNTLSAIMAIEGNPNETVDALEDFGKYLRENINILSEKQLIPFEEEINHVHRYVSLEKLRFKDRVNVYWNLEKRNFLIPPLVIQMLVENAIKHGITQKVEGGTVKISSYVKNDRIIVVIEDDGVGFNELNSIPKKGHIGLENVKKRISTVCDGTTTIESEIGKGTKVTLSLPMQGGTYESNNS